MRFVMLYQNKTWAIVVLAVITAFVGGGCDSGRTGGQAKCAQVKKGQRYSAVKKIFGRTEDARRGSHLAHTRTWTFKKGRCEVPFSGVGVRRDPRWRTGSATKSSQPRPQGIDCAVLLRRQQTCIDALVKRGRSETVKAIELRLAKLPPVVRQKRLGALEQTKKQLGQIMRQRLVGPSAKASCTRSSGRSRLSPAAAREAKQLRACLKLTDCTAYAECYWKLVGAKRVGGTRGQ